jgi:hypothetical protein
MATRLSRRSTNDIDAAVRIFGQRVSPLDARHAAPVPRETEVFRAHAFDCGDDRVGESLVQIETGFL